MIKDQDRSGWFGASDTAQIMRAWDTESFRRWWAVKLGIRAETFSSPAMRAGTAYEHRILAALGIVERDRQIRIPSLRLRVNLDGETPTTICEIKTHRGDKPFAVSKAYRQQCQVEMFASGHGLRRRKECQIIAYRLTDAEYNNYFLPIQMDRISKHPIPYDAEWIEREYLPRLKYLAACLKSGHWPREEEIPCSR